MDHFGNHLPSFQEEASDGRLPFDASESETEADETVTFRGRSKDGRSAAQTSLSHRTNEKEGKEGSSKSAATASTSDSKSGVVEGADVVSVAPPSAMSTTSEREREKEKEGEKEKTGNKKRPTSPGMSSAATTGEGSPSAATSRKSKKRTSLGPEKALKSRTRRSEVAIQCPIAYQVETIIRYGYV